MGGIIGKFNGNNNAGAYLVIDRFIVDNDIKSSSTHKNYTNNGIMIGHSLKLKNLTINSAYAEGAY